MEQRLVQEQTLLWKMNQTLLKKIQILQMSGVELCDYLKEIALENPLIEDITDERDRQQFFQTSASEIPDIGEINATAPTMTDHYKHQLSGMHISDFLKPVVLYGIGMLDDNGYLDITIEDWALDCHVKPVHIKKALTYIQAMEPAGVGARNLTECLLLQLKQSDFDDYVIKDLLQHHLEWVVEARIDDISDQYSLTRECASDLLNAIKACDPRPGQQLAASKPDYIVPEAHIFKQAGSWHIRFYKWSSPTIKLNHDYMEMTGQSEETQRYIQNKEHQIDWITSAIQYRHQTLERVIEVILNKQQLFFEHGHFMTQPLSMDEVAAILGIHTSTVSRSIAGKYVQTAHGLIPLKFFFQRSLRGQDGRETSVYTVKHLLAELIKHENNNEPLSDDQIKLRLHEAYGIIIARRTVMKYRRQLNIPASTKRKQKGDQTL